MKEERHKAESLPGKGRVGGHCGRIAEKQGLLECCNEEKKKDEERKDELQKERENGVYCQRHISL